MAKCIIEEGHSVIPDTAHWLMNGDPEKPVCNHHKGYYETAFDDYSDINWVPIEETQ